ncbi:hypothetical protein X975_24491, partial [Stegodyphus mimosarum]
MLKKWTALYFFIKCTPDIGNSICPSTLHRCHVLNFLNPLTRFNHLKQLYTVRKFQSSSTLCKSRIGEEKKSKHIIQYK